MMKLAIAGAAVAIVVMSSCRSREPREVIIERERPAPNTIVIEKSHSHGPNCGHYYYDGRWYAEPEHIHVVRVE
jgi:hypothetical protein